MKELSDLLRRDHHPKDHDHEGKPDKEVMDLHSIADISFQQPLITS
jgi:hypothetical protein